jgi:hypothetical protein
MKEGGNESPLQILERSVAHEIISYPFPCCLKGRGRSRNWPPLGRGASNQEAVRSPTAKDHSKCQIANGKFQTCQKAICHLNSVGGLIVVSMNLRQLVQIDEPYFQFDREERHMAAILFHLLNHKDNAERALRWVESDREINPAEFGVYLEYSYPRDLWNKMGVRAESNNH